MLSGLVLDQAIEPSLARYAISESGVSLSYLKKLLNTLDLYDDFTTAEAIKSLVLRITKEKKTRLIEHLPLKYRGKPSYYVVHVHSALLQDTLRTLIHNLSSTDSADNTFVWMDLFSLSQHPLGFNQQADPLFVKEVLAVCSKGAAIVVDKRSPTLILKRTWTLWEMFNAIYAPTANEESKEERGPMEATRLRICLPPDEAAAALLAFEAECSRIDLNQSETSRAEDKTKIISLVKASTGVAKMVSKTASALILSTHCSLRWSSGIVGVSLYTSLLLHSGNLGLAQSMLHQEPGVVPEDALREEMLTVLKAYAQNSDENELTRHDFAQALVLIAGFEAFEAEAIFDEISLSGEETIKIEDVPEWWRKNSEVVKMSRPADQTSESLLANLSGLQQLLIRNQQESMAKTLNTYIEPLRHTTLAPGKTLPPIKLAGDWAKVAEELTWLIHNRDFVACAPVVFRFLMLNASALKVDPFALDPPEPSDEPVVVVGKLLPTFLDLFVALIRNQQGHSRHYGRLFGNLAKKLRRSDRDQLEKLMQVRAGPPAGPNAKNLEYERHKVIKEMIELKYGEKKPTSYHLISEAEMSLGSFIAGSRAIKTGKTNEAISHMANRYLESKKVHAPGGDDEEDQTHLHASTTSLGSSFLQKPGEAPKGGENSLLFNLSNTGGGAGGGGGGGVKIPSSSMSSSQVQFSSDAPPVGGSSSRRGSSLEIQRNESRRRPSSIITDLPRCGSSIWSRNMPEAPNSPPPGGGGDMSPNNIKSGPLSLDPQSSFDQLRQSFHRPAGLKSARRHSALMPTPSPSSHDALGHVYGLGSPPSSVTAAQSTMMTLDKDGFIIVPGSTGGMHLVRSPSMASKTNLSSPQFLDSSHQLSPDEEAPLFPFSPDAAHSKNSSPNLLSKMASKGRRSSVLLVPLSREASGSNSLDLTQGELDLVSRSKSSVGSHPQVMHNLPHGQGQAAMAKAAFSLLPSVSKRK